MTYKRSWSQFEAWCLQFELQAFPAEPETVELYVVWSLQLHGYRIETVCVHLNAIADRHRSAGLPPVTTGARALIRNARRDLQEMPRHRAALTPKQLARISCDCDNGTRRGIRDRAILVLTFACGWRASEVAGLQMRHVEVREKALHLWQGVSKTDQEARGREVRIPRGRKADTCPVRLLTAWLEVRGMEPGPLFYAIDRYDRLLLRPIRRVTIYHLVKQVLERMGVDPARFGSHSLRTGMVTAAAEAGASDVAIMQRTGQRDIATFLRYVRPAQAFRNDPLRGVL
jgi:integrase